MAERRDAWGDGGCAGVRPERRRQRQVQGNWTRRCCSTSRSLRAEDGRVVEEGRRAPEPLFNLGHGCSGHRPDMLTRLVERVHTLTPEGGTSGRPARLGGRRGNPGLAAATPTADQAGPPPGSGARAAGRIGGGLHTAELAGVPTTWGEAPWCRPEVGRLPTSSLTSEGAPDRGHRHVRRPAARAEAPGTRSACPTRNERASARAAGWPRCG